MSIEVTTVMQQQQEIYGVWGRSSDKSVARNIPALSKKYYELAELPSGGAIPFFVVSKDYNEATGEFALFIGGQIKHARLEAYSLPQGMYGKVTVKPKLGFMWGMAVGEAKRYFYTKWLPSSGFSALNMEYELHTEKSLGKKPEIDLLFAISPK